MTDRLAALLADPKRAVEVPVADVPALLDAVSAQAARLDVVKSILAARLATVPSNQVPNVAEAPPGRQRDITQGEAAAAFGVPLRTLRFLTRTKRVPSYKRGRHRMLRAADVAAYIEKCREMGLALTVYHDVTMRRDARGDAAHPSEARTHPSGVRRTTRRDPGDGRAVGDGTRQGPAHG